MVQIVSLPVEDFPIDGPRQKELLQKISGSPLMAIRRAPVYPHGACYWNVDRHVKAYGGASVQGWQINWLPNLYIEATHHAVWQSADGELIDLSMPSPEVATKVGLTTFSKCLPSNLDLAWPVLIENRHVVLNQAKEVKETLAQYRINNRTNSKLRDEQKRIGWTWSVTTGWVANENRTAPLMQLSARLDKSYAELHQKRGELKQKFFSE